MRASSQKSTQSRAKSTQDWIASLRALRASTLLFTGLALFVLASAMWRGPIHLPDSHSYLSNSVTRTPVYPLFLDFLRFVFGSVSGKVAIGLQVGLGVFFAHHLGFVLRSRWGLTRGAGCAISALVLIPIARFGPTVVPESLAFALFLWFVALLFDAVAVRSARSLVGIAALAALLSLTRPQYLFLAPLVALLAAGLLAFAEAPQRRRILVAALVAGLLLASGGLAKRVYNYAVHGVFSDIPFAGIQLLTVQLYIAGGPGPPADLGDPERRRFFDLVQAGMEQKRLAHRHRDKWESDVGHFLWAYNQIVFDTMLPIYRSEFLGRDDMQPLDWVSLDELTTTIAIRMALQQPGAFVRHCLREMYQQERFFFLLAVLLPLLAAIQWWRRRDPFWAGVGLVGLAGCANYALVVIVQPIIIRYAYPTDTVVLAVVVAALLRDPPSPAPPDGGIERPVEPD